jgi:hydroxymethylpyrimidine/phosphomethylpyrimidine kinase
MNPPVILSVAGSDCSAGAGAQADLKSISATGGYGLTAITSVVSEVPGKVSRIHLMPGELIVDQIRVLAEAFPLAAAKTGMLGGLEQSQAVVAAWQKHGQGRLPLVVDPVMVATSGDALVNAEAREHMIRELLPMATLITPNMDEAAVLWGRKVSCRAELEVCAIELAARFQTAVLLKGGHLLADEAADCLVQPGLEPVWLVSARIRGVSTHGTGCSYSAAIATGLGGGKSLPEAVSSAKLFIAQAIAQHHVWHGSYGPVHALHHFAH